MLETIRKTGLMTKGTIYNLVGLLTILAALNIGAKVTGKNGVIQFLQEHPLGTIIIVLLGAGLLVYAVWRLFSAFLIPKGESSKGIGIAKKIGRFLSALIYGGLGIWLFTTLGYGTAGDMTTDQEITARLLDMNMRYGRTVLVLIALLFVGSGFYQFYQGISNRFLVDIEHHGHLKSRPTVKKSGKTGYIARAVAFIIFAWFVFQSALQHETGEVSRLEGMFNYLFEMPFGRILMVVMALGLAAYGVFQYFLAKYSSMYVSDMQNK